MTLLDALDDPAIFGEHFGPEWDQWRVFCRALFGLPLSPPPDLDLYRACTGRLEPPTAQAREAWCIAGRRAGKSRLARVRSSYRPGCTSTASRSSSRSARSPAPVRALRRSDRSRAIGSFRRRAGSRSDGS
jgi:hypothetical protein